MVVDIPAMFREQVRQFGSKDASAHVQQQIEQFLRYQQELLDWNTRMNLTAITEP